MGACTVAVPPFFSQVNLTFSCQLPDGGGVAVSSLAEEIRLRTRMRGSQSWAPPRFQIIFTVQPTNRYLWRLKRTGWKSRKQNPGGWMDGWMWTFTFYRFLLQAQWRCGSAALPVRRLWDKSGAAWVFTARRTHRSGFSGVKSENREHLCVCMM